MSNAKDAGKIAADVALAAITGKISDAEERSALELQMQSRRANGDVLADEEIEAQLDKTDAEGDELQKQIDAARDANTPKS